MDVTNSATNFAGRIDLAREADFQIGAMHVRPSHREVRLAGAPTTLEPRVMQVLIALARSAGEVVSKWDLIQSCWEGRSVGDDAINRCVAGVRRLEDAGGIKVTTIHRVGYRLTETSEPVQPIKLESGQRYSGGAGRLRAVLELARRRPWWTAGVGTMTLVLFALPIGVLLHRFETPALSIAVLPFDAQNRNADEQGFAESVSAALAERIGKTPIKVVSTTESFQYNGAAKPKAYRNLDATYIIDGSVRTDNGMMQVMLHFDNRATGETLFSKTFEASQANPLALSHRVAAGIADRMRSVALIDPARPDEAREMLGFWEAFRNGDFNTALALSQRLAQQSPNWGKLQVQHALNTALTIQFVPLPQRAARYAEAQRAIEKAAAMAPDEPLLNVARYFATPMAEWAKREALLREGLAKDTGNPDLLHFLGYELMRTGHPNEALQYLNAAVTRDQNSFNIFIDAVTDMLLVQQWNMASDLIDSHADLAVLPLERAIIDADRAQIAVESDHVKAATALLNSPALNMAGPVAKPNVIALVAQASLTGTPEDVAKALHACQDRELAPSRYGNCVEFLAECGDPDTAFAMLARLLPDMRGSTPQQRQQAWFRSIDFRLSPFAIPLLYNPRNKALRSDLRFIGIADGLGLIAYWKAKGPPEFCADEPGTPVCVLVGKRGQSIRS